MLIAAYNCATTIKATLDSVLRQTTPPAEILVLDDGSTDQTFAILKSYEPQITVFQQSNRGLADARNVLCKRAKGELIAFIDSDDVWHPNYLFAQKRLITEYPRAVASFTGHVDFVGTGDYHWGDKAWQAHVPGELISALDFFHRYNSATAPFASFTYCCIPGRVLRELGDEPFKESGGEDCYCVGLLALLGPVAYLSVPLAAYRVRPGSLSSDRLWTSGVLVHVFELLEQRYKECASQALYKAFRVAFGSRRRAYAKVLMGAGKVREARQQIRRSLSYSHSLMSLQKSSALLLLTYMPKPLQLKWPASTRAVKLSDKT